MYARALAALSLIVALLVGVGEALPAARAACGASDSQCDLRQRISAADQYLQTQPGTVGFVLRDRATGAKYRNANAATPIWTASTIKLAMVADLLTRERAGALRLGDEDRRLMVAMLRSSDNAAADTLWSRHGGTAQAFNANFPRYGMPNVRPQPGFGDVFPYWGFQKASADDFDGLMNYVLTGLPRNDAAAVVAEMQRVDSEQQWGVWGAGSAMTPGNKNGWSQEQGGWVVNSVGFAGPQQRYTLAIMNSLDGQGGYDEGVQTTTRLAQILLG
ncbi:serine hydrolase [Mycobacterium neglectum]|uniref:serine hydrolase n=1 Tax=Mycobacterium neglectum TaxID=242737 RepID=UPI000BFEF9D3|nr:serine hydrolase [Mycobacterium neglectum]